MPDARLIADAFHEHRARFEALTARAAGHFARRSWHAAQGDALERLLLYASDVDAAVARLRHGRGHDAPDAWAVAKTAFAAHVAARPDAELAATFFNSVARRLLGTVGVRAEAEFVGDEAATLGETAAAAVPPPVVVVPLAGDAPALAADVAGLLAALPLGAPFADLARDAAAVAARLLDAARRDAPGGRWVRVELLAPVFYRNKGAYVVGRLVAVGDADAAAGPPLVLALLHDERGVRVDAVLTTEDEASIVFGFSWSYLQVAAPVPRALVAHLGAVLPRKRVDERYTVLGFHRHGKTELYRLLRAHLARPDARFTRAEGERGMVMAVVTLPALNVVFKIIRDDFAPPKETTRRSVLEHYRFVFVHDRVGRLADAQEFEGLELPRRALSDALLAELRAAAASVVHESAEHVVIGHCYVQRRLVPLDRFLRDAEPRAAAAAVADYGQAIKDLAYAGIFPGDLLPKNFGVSRHGRVIFYDYDELVALDRVTFRALPQTDDPLLELSAEPWFSVGPHDVFPEEFLPFLLAPGPLRDHFVALHGELLTAEWWQEVQRRVTANELYDVYPYGRTARV